MTNWLRGLRCYNEARKCSREIFKCGAQQSSMANKHPDDVFMDFQKISLNSLQQRKGYTDATSLRRDSLECANVYLPESTSLVRTTLWRFKLPNCFVADNTRPKTFAMTTLRQYGQGAKTDSDLSRDLLVTLWLLDNKTSKIKVKRRRKTVKYADHGDSLLNDQYSIQVPFGRWFSDASTTIKKSYDDLKPTFGQPPANQPVTGTLESTSLDEAQVAPLLARSILLITRDIEWANLVLGFEQENRYAVVDVCYPQSPVGFIREQSNVIARQLLRLRRPFVAYFTDALNNELFRVRRPFWWIMSSIYAEINGKEVGVVHRRWHLWRRIYDLYIGNKQFAVVENPGFWNWTFTLKDIDGNVLAQIDRDWRGFGFEIFTDAGQYVIRFGRADDSSGAGKMIQDLEVIRPLTLLERAVTLALAVSLDNDYFSRHGGWGIPFIAVDD